MPKILKENNTDNLSAIQGTIQNASLQRIVGNTIFQDHQPFVFTESSGALGTTTLTVAQLRGGRILHTANSEDTFTLPTGTVMDAAFNDLIIGTSIFMVITNPSGNTVILGSPDASFTVTGATANPENVITATSGFYWICRLGTNSWTALRIGTES